MLAFCGFVLVWGWVFLRAAAASGVLQLAWQWAAASYCIIHKHIAAISWAANEPARVASDTEAAQPLTGATGAVAFPLGAPALQRTGCRALGTHYRDWFFSVRQ